MASNTDIAILGIRADIQNLSQAISRLEDFQRAANGAETASSRFARESARAAAAMRETESMARQLYSSFMSLAKGVIAVVTAYKAIEGIKAVTSRGMAFNSEMETSRVGIGVLIASMTKLEDEQGRVLEGMEKYNAAQKLAVGMMAELQRLGLQTTATTKELVEGMQVVMAPAIQAGMALKDIPAFATRAAQALQTIGLPLQQMRTELTALLTGHIDANDMLAPALFSELSKTEIGPKIRELKEAGKLLPEIQKRLQYFALAGDDVAHTFKGLASNFEEALDVVAGNATKKLTESVKELLQASQDLFITTEGQPGISKNFENIAGVLERFETGMGETALNLVKSLIEIVQDLNTAIGEIGVDKLFDGIVRGTQVAIPALAALVAARTAASAHFVMANGQEITGLGNYIKTVGQATLATGRMAATRIEASRVAVAAAQAELAAARANLEFAKSWGVGVRDAARNVGQAALNAAAAQAGLQASLRATGTAADMATRAKTALLNVGKGIINFFGGPLGFALTAATAAYMYLSTQESDAEKYAKSHADALKMVTGSLQESTAATDAYIKKLREMTDVEREYERVKAERVIAGAAENNSLRNNVMQAMLPSRFNVFAEDYAKIREALEEALKPLDNANIGSATVEQLQQLEQELIKISARFKDAGDGKKVFEELVAPIEAAKRVLTLFQQSLQQTGEAARQAQAAVAGPWTIDAQGVLSALQQMTNGILGFKAQIAGVGDYTNVMSALKIENPENFRKMMDAYKKNPNDFVGIYNAGREEFDKRNLGERAELRKRLFEGGVLKTAVEFEDWKGRNKAFQGSLRKPGGSGGSANIEHATEQIRRFREEIDQLNGVSSKSTGDLEKKLLEIEKAGKSAKMSAQEIAGLQKEYKDAFQSNTLNKFNKELLQLEGRTKELRQIEISEKMQEWRNKLEGLGLSSEEAEAKLLRLQEALQNESQEKDFQTSIGFYKELAELSGNYTTMMDLQTQAIERQAEAYIRAGIPEHLVRQWEALKKLQESRDPWAGIYRGLKQYADDATNLGQQLEGAVTNAFQGMEDAFVNFVQTGKMEFNDFANSIIADLMRIAVRTSITGPLAAGIGSFFNGLFSGGGAATTAAGSSALFDGPASMGYAHGGVLSGGTLHDYSNTIVTRPTFFGYGKHYTTYAHGAGLMGEAGPEAIMPLTRTSSGDLGVRAVPMFGGNYSSSNGPEVNINIYNETGTQMEAQGQMRQDSFGNFNLDIIVTQIEQNMVSNAKAGRSPYTSYLDTTRGLNRAGVLQRSRR